MLDIQRKGSITFSIGSLVVDEGPASDWVSALCFPECLDVVGWTIGKDIRLENYHWIGMQWWRSWKNLNATRARKKSDLDTL